MRIELFHASHYGNGEMVAEDFKQVMAGKGVEVNVHHIDESDPKAIPPADLYLFSSPGRFGKPIKGMRKFLERLQLPPGSRYVLLTTEMNPAANTPVAKEPSQELGACQMVIPNMDEILQAKGLKKIADGKIFVTGLKGPLELAWKTKVQTFAEAVLRLSSEKRVA